MSDILGGILNIVAETEHLISQLVNNVDQIRQDLVNELAGEIVNSIVAIDEKLASLEDRLQSIATGVDAIYARLKGLPQETADLIDGKLGSVGDTINQHIDQSTTTILSKVDEVNTHIDQSVEAINNHTDQVVGDLVSGINSIGSQIAGALADAADTIASTIENAIDRQAEIYRQSQMAVSEATDRVADRIASLTLTMHNDLSSMSEDLVSALDSHARTMDRALGGVAGATTAAGIAISIAEGVAATEIAAAIAAGCTEIAAAITAAQLADKALKGVKIAKDVEVGSAILALLGVLQNFIDGDPSEILGDGLEAIISLYSDIGDRLTQTEMKNL